MVPAWPAAQARLQGWRADGRRRRAQDPGRGRGGLLAPGRANCRGRAGALPAWRADQLGRLAALPRAHRRRGARPAGLRALGQAGRLRLLDRRLRPVPRGVPRRRGHRSLLAGGARLGGSGPGHGPAPARAGGAARGHQHRAVHWPATRWHRVARIWRRAMLGELAMGFTTRFGLQALTARGVRRLGAARRSSSTPSGATSTTAPSGRSSSSTAPPARRSSSRRAAIWAPSGARPWCCGAIETTTSPRASGGPTREALGEAATLEVVEGAGHWVWLDRPEVVARVAAFLSGSR